MPALLAVAPPHARSRAAAHPGDSVVLSRGHGPGVVLLSGLLGGTTRLVPLADALAERGFRVLVINPYRLASGAPDVSFNGIAHEVEAALAREGMEHAVVVAHGHATSIAVNLAADAPERVQQLVLLDGGLLPSTRSPGLARALQLASFVAHLPGGKSLIRSRLLGGIRANSGGRSWLSDAAAHDYADALLAELPEATRIMRRLASTREPAPPAKLCARVHAEVVILVGGAPHESTPAGPELVDLAVLPTVHMRLLRGVGHFVHEEAMDEVVREVEAAYTRLLASR